MQSDPQIQSVQCGFNSANECDQHSFASTFHAAAKARLCFRAAQFSTVLASSAEFSELRNTAQYLLAQCQAGVCLNFCKPL